MKVEEIIEDFDILKNEIIQLIIIAEKLNIPIISVNGYADKKTVNDLVYMFASYAVGCILFGNIKIIF